MSTPELSLLGKVATYSDHYDPSLLFPIPRADKRAELGLGAQVPFFGADLWTAYELSWLTPRGKPQVAIAHVTVPCETPFIVESKSFKLYLNSFNGTAFASAEEVRETLRCDLAQALWQGHQGHQGQQGQQGQGSPGSVGVRLVLPDAFGQEKMAELEGLSLDRLEIDCDRYTPAPEYLRAAVGEPPVEETLCSQLLKSNCLVTGQPDWGSVQIRYSGPAIDQAGLLRYLVSFRNHNEFHEQCVERIFMDVWRACRPVKLSVYARYTRRGGLDISPWRSSHPGTVPPTARTARQ